MISSTKARTTIILVILVLSAVSLDVDFLRQESCRHTAQTLSKDQSVVDAQELEIVKPAIPVVGMTLLSPTIPHRLAFNFHTNLWETNLSKIKGRSLRSLAFNVNHTVHMFLDAWNATLQPQNNTNNGNADDNNVNDANILEVVYLVDDDCERIINETEPRLYEAFQSEKGSHKSDMCRVIDLYVNGGYYFDNDLFVENAPILGEHVTFSTVLEANHEKFFQAFTAATPQHPILKEALDLMVAFYVEGLQPKSLGYPNMNMGTWTMREAHKRAVAKDPSLSQQLHFLQEMNLEDHKSWDLGVIPDKNWRHYNHVSVDLQSNLLCFWARLGVDLIKRQGWNV